MAFAKLSGALLARKDTPAALTLAELVSVPVSRPPDIPAPAPAAQTATVAAPAATSPKPSTTSTVADAAVQKSLARYLAALKLPAFLREYDKLARECAEEGLEPAQFLLRLAELELNEREQQNIQRRIRAAQFPALKTLDTFDFTAVPLLDKNRVVELASCDYIERRENVIILGASGIGKTHIAIGLGMAACQKGVSVGFVTAARVMHELREARDEQRLIRLHKRLVSYELLIIDELGFVPLSTAGAELMFQVISQRYESNSMIITSNLPFEEWSEVFGNARLAGAVVERVKQHSHVIEMSGHSYRLRQA